jgi:hypothetical protein
VKVNGECDRQWKIPYLGHCQPFAVFCRRHIKATTCGFLNEMSSLAFIHHLPRLHCKHQESAKHTSHLSVDWVSKESNLQVFTNSNIRVNMVWGRSRQGEKNKQTNKANSDFAQ